MLPAPSRNVGPNGQLPPHPPRDSNDNPDCMSSLVDSEANATRWYWYPGRASGSVVDTVQTVLHAFCAHGDFETAPTATVNLGDDADTTGALVGMLAGARCGARALPRRWLRKLSPAVVQAVTDQVSDLVSSAHGRWRADPQRDARSVPRSEVHIDVDK